MNRAAFIFVVGGLLGINETWLRNKEHADSFSNWKAGVYYVDAGTDRTEAPSGSYGYGVLLVLVTGNSFMSQIYIADKAGEIYCRERYSGNSKTWVKINTTEVG